MIITGPDDGGDVLVEGELAVERHSENPESRTDSAASCLSIEFSLTELIKHNMDDTSRTYCHFRLRSCTGEQFPENILEL